MVAGAAREREALYRIAPVAGARLAAVCATASVALGTAAAPVHAEEALARQRNCFNCHALERKVVGPGFRQVAARYAGRADAVPYLAEKIVKGGAGAWGPVAMAANPQVSADEARRLAGWVLSLK
ncbi:MAG: c-type cytochrome [Rubrivivax sp.]|nr:c-type cytochrome [Rubrivivax sp.]